MTIQEHQAIQKMGAEARARGASQINNPFLVPRENPGLTPDEVSERWEAWELGWEMENAMRPSGMDRLIQSLTS